MEDVLLVMEATGLDNHEDALHLLEANGGEVERAVEAFFGGEEREKAEREEEREERERSVCREPLPAYHDVIGEDHSASLNKRSLRPRAPHQHRSSTQSAPSPFAASRAPIDVFREFEREGEWQRGKRAKVEKLADLFRPPLEIMFPGSFEEAKVFALQENKLLLVSLLAIDNFDCQRMNRDTWKDEGVTKLIQNRFVLWQVYTKSEDAGVYERFYTHEVLPHVAVVDPRTGERVFLREGFVLPHDLVRDLQRVMNETDYFPFSAAAPQADKKESKMFVDMTEEEQVLLAMRQSLAHSQQSDVKYVTEDGSDFEFGSDIEDQEDYFASPQSSDDHVNPENENLSSSSSSLVSSASTDTPQSSKSSTDRKRKRSSSDERESDSVGSHETSPQKVKAPSHSLIVVDEQQQVTHIQVRLLGNKKLIVKANATHTVDDLLSHIIASSENTQTSFELFTTFPRKNLSSLSSMTLQEAGLLNAVVVQEKCEKI